MWYGILVGSIIGITTLSLLFFLPLYLIVLIVVIRNRQVEPFNSEFFTVFVALGFVDIRWVFVGSGEKRDIFWGKNQKISKLLKKVEK